MGSHVLFFCIVYSAIVLLSLITIAIAIPISWMNFEKDTEFPKIVNREEWGARMALGHTLLGVTPTPYVVVHHGGIPCYCNTQESCSAVVRNYQNLHIDGRGWADIGYNFVIGEDGNAYEGRGWNFTGAHAPGYNNQSIGICVIGDFSDFLPDKAALKTLNGLIDYGVSLGKISKDYRVIGHRQARDTLCPGEELYKYVQTNPRWTSKPTPSYSKTNVTKTAEIIPIVKDYTGCISKHDRALMNTR